MTPWLCHVSHVRHNSTLAAEICSPTLTQLKACLLSTFGGQNRKSCQQRQMVSSVCSALSSHQHIQCRCSLAFGGPRQSRYKAFCISVWLDADAACEVTDVLPGLKGHTTSHELTASTIPLPPHLLPAGRNYDGTRHNVGFAAIDELGLQAGIELKKVELNAILGRGR